MTPHAGVALLVLCTSLLTTGGGAWLVRRAHAMTPPAAPEMRRAPGTITDVLATTCGRQNAPRTCYRSVAEYEESGQAVQVVSKTAYRPARHAAGDRVTVLVSADGTAWIDAEWADRQAARERDHASARRFPLVMGWLLVGCGAFGLLLAAGLVFWVDESE